MILKKIIVSLALLLSTLLYVEKLNAAQSDSNQALKLALKNMQEAILAEPLVALEELESLSIADAQLDKELRLLWLLRKAEAYNFSFQFDRFKVPILEGKNLLDDNSPPEIAAMFYLYSAIISQRRGDYLTAGKELQQAFRLSNSVTDPYVKGYVLLEIGYNDTLEEKYESSLKYLQEAFRIAKENNNPLLIAQTYEVYGVLYSYTAKMESSVEYYQKAREIYLKLGYPYFIAESTFGLASNYRRWEKWQQAIEGFEQYRAAVGDLTSSYTQFYYHYGISLSYANSGNCDKAMPLFSAGLSIDGFKDYKAELYKKQALCFADLGDFQSADNSVARARAIFDEIPELKGTTWQIEVDKIAAQVAAKRKNYRQAYQLIEQYYQAVIDVQRRNTSQSVEELKLELQSEREILELELLENKTQLQELMLNNQQRQIQIQRLWLYGSISVILIVLIFLWWQFRVSRKFASLAITDELTGLANRRFIFSTIEKIVLHRSQYYRHSLFLIDVDDLKPINDIHGHQVGDAVLKTVARVGREISRDGDVFARIGGDEFMLLLTRTDEKTEELIATRLLESISAESVEATQGDLVVPTVSIGVAAFDNNTDTPAKIYAQVDEALYRAKSSGRNRFSR
ncbi:tetratricopeptide repeat-containing diguanylate cyclase [Aliikangiella marina]|uniref:tetratricopeptide repeat-containing diguanylate cyclase n=1 Tax=Aliikangiella marina TaxID=1712262 RepID=UPI00163D71EE|nr:tetratricopeptide repeat-containing diguanylate cyclase [Aliikangiella marina]